MYKCVEVLLDKCREKESLICYDSALAYSSLLTRTAILQSLNNLIQLLISRQYSLKTP